MRTPGPRASSPRQRPQQPQMVTGIPAGRALGSRGQHVSGSALPFPDIFLTPGRKNSIRLVDRSPRTWESSWSPDVTLPAAAGGQEFTQSRCPGSGVGKPTSSRLRPPVSHLLWEGRDQ